MATANELHRQAWSHKADHSPEQQLRRLKALAYLLRNGEKRVAVALGLLPDPGPEVLP